MYKMSKFPLPDIFGSEKDCILDFDLRKKNRLRYPGACSLEFQSVIQIVLECLFQWDTKHQKAKGPGILGTPLAFAPADEEQNRFTLHRHWQVWIKEINQTLRRNLFHKDDHIKEETRKKFYNYIDQVMSASYGEQLEITHNCNDPPNKGQICQRPDQIVRDARCKELAKEYEGKILECDTCHKELSTEDIIDYTLKRWKALALQDLTHRQQKTRTHTNLPLEPERLDIAAYTYSYHMEGGCQQINDKFWGDSKVRKVLLTLRFDQHDCNHRRACFKKGCECRFYFPFGTIPSTIIHEDGGCDREHEITWQNLDGTTTKLAPWLIMPKRPMGCQYINVHNNTIQEVLNCNTNVQIGDPTQVYYNTLYNSKSTQAEDAEKQRRVGNTITRRLLRIQEEIEMGARDEEEETDNFVEGLCRLLSGMNAATTRDVISATMAHLLMCNNGTRFPMSHGFARLLITQMEAALNNEPTYCRIRVNIFQGNKVAWQDSSADNYFYRPNQLEGVCTYEFTMKFQQVYNTIKQIRDIESRSHDDSDEDDDNDPDNHQGPTFRYSFIKAHPGYNFSHLVKRQKEVIPIITIPRGKLGRIEHLELETTHPTEETSLIRENYAKMALMMFYPFRTLDDLKKNDSYWLLFESELKQFKEGYHTTFWRRGFVILQNIQDKYTLEKKIKLHRARDPITTNTKCGQTKVDKTTNPKQNNGDEFPDITEFTTSQDET